MLTRDKNWVIRIKEPVLLLGLQRYNEIYCWPVLTASYAMLGDVGPSVVCPSVVRSVCQQRAIVITLQHIFHGQAEAHRR